MSSNRPIDWRSIDDINKDLDHLEQIKKDPDSPFGSIGPVPVEMDQILTLKVRVIDPELAQAVLGRSFVSSDEGSRIPGLALDEIVILPDAQRKQQLAEGLQLIAQRLQDDPELLDKLADPNWHP